MGQLLSSILSNVDRQWLSDATGTASFVVWLFAQSPQLYENYSRSSVEGLSPVFLVQWAGGDLTNLMGCLLTHQLPFQIAVATYFCMVDCCIAMQYYYYWRRDRLLEIKAAKRRSKVHARRFEQPSALENSGLLDRVGGERSGRDSSRSSSKPTRQRTNSNWSYHSWRAGSLNRGVGMSSREQSQDEGEDLDESDLELGKGKWKGDYFNYQSTSPPRRRVPVYANELVGTTSYRALSQAAISVAELAEEAARRSLENSRIYEDRESRSRPGSTRSLSIDWKKENRRLRSEAKGNKSSKSKSKSKSSKIDDEEWKSTHPHTDLSPTRENRAEGSAFRNGSRGKGEIPHNMIDSLVSLKSSDSRSSQGYSKFDFGTKRRTRKQKKDQDADKDRKGKQKEQTGLEQSIESLSKESIKSNSTAISSSNSSISEKEGTLRRGRDMVRTAQAVAMSPQDYFGNHDEHSPCPSDFTTVPGTRQQQQQQHQHAQIRSHDQSRPTTTSRTQSKRSLSKRLLPLSFQSPTKSQSPSAARRGTGMVLLAAFGFLIIRNNTSTSGLEGTERRDLGLGKGRVLLDFKTERSSPEVLFNSNSNDFSINLNHSSNPKSYLDHSSFTLQTTFRHPLLLYQIPISSSNLLSLIKVEKGDDDDDGEGPGRTAPPPVDASWERIIGRISAWTCCLLYMTSRIPQIWENMRRKSIAGLSILLFIAAFTGNLLYTISILANPLSSGPTSKSYLSESVPFLLGSGGTLGFDFIIIFQWLLWRHKIEGVGGKEEPSVSTPSHHHSRSSSKPRASRKSSERGYGTFEGWRSREDRGPRSGDREAMKKTWPSKTRSRGTISPEFKQQPVFRETRQREESRVSFDGLKNAAAVDS